MNVDELLLPLALILVVAKLFSILGKKLGLPQVVGMIVAGILLGLVQSDFLYVIVGSIQVSITSVTSICTSNLLPYISVNVDI